MSRLAEELSVEKDSIKAQLNRYTRRSRHFQKQRAVNQEATAGMAELERRSHTEAATPKTIKAQDRLIALLIKYPKCAKQCQDFDPERLSSAFMKKVYRLTVSLINDGRDTDLINYSGELSDSELGRLSGIIARFNDSSDYAAEFQDCLQVINDAYDGLQSVNAEAFDGDDFNALFKKLADKQNRGNNT